MHRAHQDTPLHCRAGHDVHITGGGGRRRTSSVLCQQQQVAGQSELSLKLSFQGPHPSLYSCYSLFLPQVPSSFPRCTLSLSLSLSLWSLEVCLHLQPATFLFFRPLSFFSTAPHSLLITCIEAVLASPCILGFRVLGLPSFLSRSLQGLHPSGQCFRVRVQGCFLFLFFFFFSLYGFAPFWLGFRVSLSSLFWVCSFYLGFWSQGFFFFFWSFLFFPPIGIAFFWPPILVYIHTQTSFFFFFCAFTDNDILKALIQI